MNLLGRHVTIEGLLFAYCTTGMMKPPKKVSFLGGGFVRTATVFYFSLSSFLIWKKKGAFIVRAKRFS